MKMRLHLQKFLFWCSVGFILFFGMSLAFVPLAQGAGATLSITPASGEFEVGQTITATLNLHTGGNLINVVDATLNFSPKTLRVVSISKASSIFSFWPVEPTFDNNQGIISFVGGTSTYFSGSSGVVLRITFSIKTKGEGFFNLSGGRILIADGKGTDVFAGSQGASWKFTTTRVPVRAIGAPSAPKISSLTHPNPEEWYSKSTATFLWQVGKDITGVRLLYDRKPTALPTVFYSSSINEKTFDNLDDGAWYFHVRLRNIRGWGETSHFRFQIDTESPEPFSVIFLDGKKTTNPQPIINFDTTDSLSGISHYELKIADGDFFTVAELPAHNPYKLPIQTSGTRTILVRAFDKADNYTDAIDEFTILDPLPLPKPPIITSLKTIITFLVLLILLMLWYGWWKLIPYKKRLHKEIREADQIVHKSFDLLKENIEEKIRRLEKTKSKRELTKEEHKILAQFKRDMDDAEKFIRKEIKNIEKEVK